jgi:DNA-binding beta-propeller fold protein YncE
MVRIGRACCLAAAAILAATVAYSQTSFVTFETGLVRPLALSPDGQKLFAVNAPDGRLEIFDVDISGITHSASIPVGMEPVAVVARSDTEVWVVNHLSDSVSIVTLTGIPRVTRTLLVGDEPSDIVFAGLARNRAFITAAHRGQNTPYPRGDYDVPGTGRADVWVFDATDLGSTLGGTPLTIVTLFGDKPRALAVSPDASTVYAAVFRSGNRTTAIHESSVCDSSAASIAAEVAEGPCASAGTALPGGYPPPLKNLEGLPFDETGLIVKVDRDGGATGRWLDELGRDWSDVVRFDLPDLDVFAIAATSNPPVQTAAYPQVGTLLFNMATNPVTGRLYVSNTEALNEIRFEGAGTLAAGIKPLGEPPSVRGRFSQSRISVIDGAGNVSPRHLNKHLDYDATPQPPSAKARSLATPLDIAVSADGTTLYVAAFGSSKIGVFETAELEADTFVPSSSRHIALSGGGPAGVVLDGDRLYTLLRFENSVAVVDLTQGLVGAEIQKVPLFNPEPRAVVEGRPFLYDALATSSTGEASCAGCHPFGDMDDLAWDLGNPDGVVVPNGNIVSAGNPTPFHPIKGPMATQSLRGMVNMGPQHWRGDRQGDASAAFNAFNVAFPDLLGRDEGELTPSDMQKFTDFILEVTYPPNPIRTLDDSLRPDEATGQFLLTNGSPDTTGKCVACHPLVPHVGFFGANGFSADQFGPREFKSPHLRNLYQKVGMFGMARTPRLPTTGDYAHKGPQVRGFGFFHDGSIDTVFRFMDINVFLTFDDEQRELEAFMLAFPSDLAPMVGQQITKTASSSSAVDARINQMLTAASTPYPSEILGDGSQQCDVVATGVVAGERVGALRLADGRMQLDDNGAPIAESVFRSLASVAGQELTYTCVPSGSGVRIGIDRDEDGRYNRADNCPAVFNPQQTDANDDGVGDVCELGATTTTTTTTTLATTTTTTLPSIDVLEIESLQISGLSHPAGDQKLKLKSGELDATSWSFDPPSDGLTLIVERSPVERWMAVIPAGAAGWRVSPDGRRYKWKRPSGAPPSALRALSLGLRNGYVKLRASSQVIDASWAAGAAMLVASLEAGSGSWAGTTPACASSANTLRCR